MRERGTRRSQDITSTFGRMQIFKTATTTILRHYFVYFNENSNLAKFNVPNQCPEIFGCYNSPVMLTG